METQNLKPLTHLIGYIGIIQIVHFVSLVFAAITYFTTGLIGFPASGPGNGWTEQAIQFLLGCGYTDAGIIVITEYFVLKYLFYNQLSIRLGIGVLTGSISTAIVFAFGTIPSGAWRLHPGTYGSLVILFIPFFILYIKLWRHHER